MKYRAPLHPHFARHVDSLIESGELDEARRILARCLNQRCWPERPFIQERAELPAGSEPGQLAV